MRTEDLIVGSVYTFRRSRNTAESLAVVIASDRQYGIWYDSYEKNYRLFEYAQGMLADSRGVAVVPIPQEVEDELLVWNQAQRPVVRFPAVEAILTRYEQLGDTLRGMADHKDVRWSEHVLGELLIIPPNTITGDLAHYAEVSKHRRLKQSERQNVNGNAVVALRERFNAAFVPLTALGIELDLILDSPHGAHSRVSIEDLERLAEFVNKHSLRRTTP